MTKFFKIVLLFSRYERNILTQKKVVVYSLDVFSKTFIFLEESLKKSAEYFITIFYKETIQNGNISDIDSRMYYRSRKEL